MSSGYVLDFTDRSFRDFISENAGVDIADEKYNYHSGSKANRLRAFWTKESDSLVSRLMRAMLEYLQSSRDLSCVHWDGTVQNYRDASGEIRDYYPDFIVKTSEKELYIVETKGREDLDDPLKIARLRQWCEDVNKSQSKMKCHCLYVRQEEYEKYTPKNFTGLIKTFSNK